MLNIKDKSQCCGCAACANICPRGCLHMQPDEEGFLHPVADKGRCVDCGLCERVCPIKNAVKETAFPQEAYLVQNRDAQTRRRSTSGGAFTAIARAVLAQGGVVFGAAFEEGFHVRHVCVSREEELHRFQNSKYVQSEIGDTFALAKQYLESGSQVCFSGTPCQIEGLRRYLRKEYESLICVDVVCRAVPSPLVWEHYLQMQQARCAGRAANYVFRDKSKFGYQSTCMAIYGKGSPKPIYQNGLDSDPYLKAFFSNICDRPSCYHCQFKKRYRVSDITLWDCFETKRLAPELDDNRGTTRVLIHSDKGRAVFEKIKEQLRFVQRSPEALTADAHEMFHSVPENPGRAAFLQAAAQLPLGELFQHYFRPTLRSKCEKLTRGLLCRLGIYSWVKSTAKDLLARVRRKDAK